MVGRVTDIFILTVLLQLVQRPFELVDLRRTKFVVFFYFLIEFVRVLERQATEIYEASSVNFLFFEVADPVIQSGKYNTFGKGRFHWSVFIKTHFDLI